MRRFPPPSSLRDRAILLALTGALVVTAAIILNAIANRREQAWPPRLSSLPPSTLSNSPRADGQPTLPTVEVARVNPKGEAVIAGHADPGSAVEIAAGGRIIGSTAADDQGEWVFVPEKPLEPGAHRLSLRSNGRGREPVSGLEEILVLINPLEDRSDGRVPAKARERPTVLKILASGTALVLQAPAGNGKPPSAIRATE